MWTHNRLAWVQSYLVWLCHTAGGVTSAARRKIRRLERAEAYLIGRMTR